jgi:hypothetical protein
LQSGLQFYRGEENMDNLESSLKVIKNIFGLSGLIGNVIGTIIVIFYCCTIRFFPAGLSVGDVLFCLCIFAIFGVLYIVFTGILYLANKLFLLYFLFKKKINKTSDYVSFYEYQKSYLGFSIYANLFILLCTCFVWVESGNLISSLLFCLTTYLAVGVISWLETLIFQWEENKILNKYGLSEKYDKKLYSYIWNMKVSIKFIFRTGICIIPMIIVSGIYVGLTNITLSLIGVRQSDVTIYVDKNYQDLFYNSENKDYFDKINCSSACQLEHVNILMTNIGTKTKFQIPAKTIHNTTDSPIEFEVPNEAIKGIRNK